MDYMVSIGVFTEDGIPSSIKAMNLWKDLQALLNNKPEIDLELITGYCMK
jgi:hypothetical protein